MSTAPRINYAHRKTGTPQVHLVAELLFKDPENPRTFTIDTPDQKQMKIILNEGLEDLEVSEDQDANIYEFFGQIDEDDDETLKVIHYVSFGPSSAKDQKERETLAFDMKAYNEAVELIHNERFSELFL
mmetsp:Transcript_6901/g.25742  ORF Transcript_6901/g.25742 Transcript_6901/m.25742 type:complete len:129 (-) Transcript_6901:125-511(-)|eukprot:CAMPEP_0117444286 /NCGR_PEP_ID=MMETSP0759-20121206/5160_1 /TAXON_ID=63605 /ORGANISM="Percolomonas cosmopolitus, Strain WS" /LENGTH=128 /DNA_ID=CAMNT_0005236343 /DNA_START=7 /DNA_END=393 /DNA_ORIENTATION=+